MGSDERDAGTKLAALLEPHLDELRAAEPEPALRHLQWGVAVLRLSTVPIGGTTRP